MATILNQQDEDENKVGLNQPGGQQLSSASGLSGGQASNSQATQGAKAPTNTGYVNLSRYVDANKEGTSNMTGQLVNNIDEKRGAAETGLNNSYNKFQSGANSQNMGANKNMLNSISGDGDLASLAGNPDAARMRNMQYTGPSGLDTGYQSGLNQAETYANNSQSQDGRKELLRDQYDNGRYTRGLGGLDSALIGTDQNAATSFENIRNQVGDLRGLETTYNQNARGVVDNKNNQAWQTRNDYNKALTTRLGKMDDVSQQRANEHNAYAKWKFAQDAANTQSGVSQADYMTKNAAATKDDFRGENKAQYEALRSLGANIGDIGDARDFYNPYTMDRAGFDKAVSAAQQQADAKRRLAEEAGARSASEQQAQAELAQRRARGGTGLDEEIAGGVGYRTNKAKKVAGAGASIFKRR